MLAILSTVDSGKRIVSENDISFIHLLSSSKKDIEIEARPYALAFARQLNLEKVYLFYGEKGRLVYGFTL